MVPVRWLQVLSEDVHRLQPDERRKVLPLVLADLGRAQLMIADLFREASPSPSGFAFNGPDPDRWLPPQEVGRMLGGLSKKYIYELARSGRLRGKKVGKYWRFREADVLEFRRALLEEN